MTALFLSGYRCICGRCPTGGPHVQHDAIGRLESLFFLVFRIFSREGVRSFFFSPKKRADTERCLCKEQPD
ncbi:hypothetical protein [Pandoravirus japonicus]|uniref:Uncharacterized protein n=1 Tax=Pandoravirus japonicus TaxID=2823154 RepID=A0A811BLQ1_9VIRU|nr:hypothetical protein [Pandoravirus japonicus]